MATGHRDEQRASGPGFPFDHHFLIDQDLAFLDLIRNGIGWILETTPFDPSESLHIPLGEACIAYNGIIFNVKFG